MITVLILAAISIVCIVATVRATQLDGYGRVPDRAGAPLRDAVIDQPALSRIA